MQSQKFITDEFQKPRCLSCCFSLARALSDSLVSNTLLSEITTLGAGLLYTAYESKVGKGKEEDGNEVYKLAEENRRPREMVFTKATPHHTAPGAWQLVCDHRFSLLDRKKYPRPGFANL